MQALKNPYVIIGLLLAFGVGIYLYFKYIIMLVTRSAENKNVKAFLMMIRKCEGTAGANGYVTMFGGKTFTDTSKHPNVCVPYKNTCSTAAGAYQFLKRTWDGVATQLGLTDFSVKSQDLAAIELIRRRGALVDVVNGRIEIALHKCRKEWASLPNAGYGQPEKSVPTALGFYKSAGGSLA